MIEEFNKFWWKKADNPGYLDECPELPDGHTLDQWRFIDMQDPDPEAAAILEKNLWDLV